MLADSFVVKPYEEQHLLSRIEYILANEKLRARRPGKGVDATKLELFFGGHSHFLARLPKVENAIDLLLGAMPFGKEGERHIQHIELQRLTTQHIVIVRF